MILRQVASVAVRLEPAAEALCAMLGLRVACRDPGVGRFGLENVELPWAASEPAGQKTRCLNGRIVAMA